MNALEVRKLSKIFKQPNGKEFKAELSVTALKRREAFRGVHCHADLARPRLNTSALNDAIEPCQAVRPIAIVSKNPRSNHARS